MTDATEEVKEKTEEVEVSGEKLVERIKGWANEAKVRRVRVIEPDGDVAIDLPLTVGAIGGGAVVLAAPVLAALGALAALVSHVKVVVVREEEPEKTS